MVHIFVFGGSNHNFCFVLGLFFWSKTIFLNDRKNLKQFDHNVRKGRLVNTATASFGSQRKQIGFVNSSLAFNLVLPSPLTMAL